MKSDSSSLFIIRFLIWLVAVGTLISSLFLPWAYGRAVLGLFSEKVYLHQSEELHQIGILVLLIIVIAFISGLVGLFLKRYIISGSLSLLMGLSDLGLGYYVWLQIDAKDINFLGVGPLKLAEVYPDIGVLVLIMAGFLLIVNGLLWLFIR